MTTAAKFKREKQDDGKQPAGAQREKLTWKGEVVFEGNGGDPRKFEAPEEQRALGAKASFHLNEN